MTKVEIPKLALMRTFKALCLVAFALGICGCSSMKTTGTARSGTEQLLLTNTWEQVLSEVDLRPLSGLKVALDITKLEAADKGWVVATLQRNLLRHGVILQEDKKDASLILVVALAAYATDQREFTIGFQGSEVDLVGLSFSAPNLFQAKHQSAVVKLTMFAYDSRTSRLVWEAPPLSTSNSLQDRFVFGTGPDRRTTVQDVDVYPATRVRRSSRFPWQAEPLESLTWMSVPTSSAEAERSAERSSHTNTPEPPCKHTDPQHSTSSKSSQTKRVWGSHPIRVVSTWATHDSKD